MHKVLGLVVCLALTGSIASAFTPDVKLADLREGAAKIETPAYAIVPVNGGRGGELHYKVNFIHTNGTVKALVDVGDKDYATVKRFGGYVEVHLYAGKNRGHLKLIRTEKMRHDDKKVVTFPAPEVCNHFGVYTRYLKVWASARTHNGDAMPFYKSNINGKHIRVTCNSSFWGGFTIID